MVAANGFRQTAQNGNIDMINQNNIYVAQSIKNLEAASIFMDDDIREAIHSDARATDAAWFLAEYCARHKAKFGEDFSWA